MTATENDEVVGTYGDGRSQRSTPMITPALAILWRRRWLIIGAAVGGLLLGVLWATFFGRKYTVSASFVVQSRRDLAGLSGIAAQFGLQIPLGDAEQSPQFYSDLVGTASVLGSLSACPVAQREDSTRRALAQVVMPGEEPAQLQQDKMIRWLQKRVLAAANTKSGVVTVKFGYKDPVVAYGAMTCVLDILDDYNRRIRRSNASAERRFAELRTKDAEDSLRAAENTLQRFLERNRAGLNTAPPLKFEEDRLTRRQQERQEVVSALKQMLERARLDEVRDTPVISIVEAPRLPALPDSGTRSRAGILGAIVGLFLVSVWLILADGWPRMRAMFAPERREAERSAWS